jgi:hypothetical protein
MKEYADDSDVLAFKPRPALMKAVTVYCKKNQMTRSDLLRSAVISRILLDEPGLFKALAEVY